MSEIATLRVNENLVSRGLELMLEPTIANNDQCFLDNWYSGTLKEFSVSLMKNIVQFCELTMAEITTGINKTETPLKSSTNQEQFKANST